MRIDTLVVFRNGDVVDGEFLLHNSDLVKG
jgi:hypothetical protein